MDRLVVLRVVEDEPEFSWRRAGWALLAAVAVMVAASLLVRMYPNPGVSAGYQAVVAAGRDWVRSQVDAAGGVAIGVCDGLYPAGGPSAPTYDYPTFVQGCGEAVDFLYGSHVPMVRVVGGTVLPGE